MSKLFALIAALTLTASLTGCGTTDPAGALPTSAAASAPTTAAVATSAAAVLTATRDTCAAFDKAFELLIGDDAAAAQTELKASYSKPDPALAKLRTVAEKYAAALQDVAARNQDPALKTVLDLELFSARAAISLPGSGLGGEKIHIAWMKSYLSAGGKLAPKCPAESLPIYHVFDDLRTSVG